MKKIIGMVHLKALPGAPKNSLSMEEIYLAAKADLEALEEAGVKYAIVENMFDDPYAINPSIETLSAMAVLYARLKDISKIELGINIHAADGVEEMVVAHMCNAAFIRAESFVEFRYTSTGLLKPMAAGLMRKKRELNSKVKIFADVNVKHSNPAVDQEISDIINQAIEAGADEIILTGLATGKAPTAEDAKLYKQICGDVPLLIGSGVNVDNIGKLMEYADGAIIGSSIKKDGIVSNPVDVDRTRQLLEQLR